MNKAVKSKSEYYLADDNRFVIENYTKKSPFSSFLPGIAGLMGIPMWVFYVNRGQGICSFGIRDKDKPIMEFLPAYKALQQVEFNGFRTFIRMLDDNGCKYYEPFTSVMTANRGMTKMYIGASGLAIEDVNREYGLKTEVEYFTLPNEKLAALVRKVTVTNISGKEKALEILDGMPVVIPYGINNDGLKQIGNTLKGWMEVYNMENRIPFYKLRAEAEDKEDVNAVTEGHFYLCFDSAGKGQLMEPIADPAVVFGDNTSLSCPERFIDEGLDRLMQKHQVPSNKIPCGFFGAAKKLAAEGKIEFYSLIGHIPDMGQLNDVKEKFTSADFIEKKRMESEMLVRELTQDIYTKTASPIFDEYCRQTYLDNLLRGGYPLTIRGRAADHTYYVYSRKHGDLERDYNYFVTEPEFYSNGNGNYRDVNQNRCNDVFFHPEVQTSNIRTFMNLIQADGYNPLVITGDKLILSERGLKTVIRSVSEKHRKRFEKILSKPFTLGRLHSTVMDDDTILSIPMQEFIDLVVSESELITEAIHGEGYWVDHWVYNLDLIEKYLRIYPDNEAGLMFGKEYVYYDNEVVVRNRDEKYLSGKGTVMQLNATELCAEKESLISGRCSSANILRSMNGKGEIYRSSLLAKLVVLAVNKFSCLDSRGMGIEMEAGKPGWNDALNGLPGLFGSSVADSCELVRLLDFILGICDKYRQEKLELPKEVWALLEKIMGNIEGLGTFEYWNRIADAKEIYRESIRFGFSGVEKELDLPVVYETIKLLQSKLELQIGTAFVENGGIHPTYFYYQPVEYEKLYNDRDLVQVRAFEQRRMPIFLEGAVKGLKICRDKADARRLYEKVKESGLFDKKLRMYKICEPLNGLPESFGRITAFTPGWFENETVWLHMEYKYILEVLNQELYEEFFSDFRNMLIPFLKPEIYGRSVLENSSFIASSANPDEAIHGKGFVARLSGATAEFLSIWNIMMAGHRPFELQEGKLCLKLKPILPGWLFDEKDEISFMFLGRTTVTYHNPQRKSTYPDSMQISTQIIRYRDGIEVTLAGQVIPEPYSTDIRSGKVEKIYATIQELHPIPS